MLSPFFEQDKEDPSHSDLQCGHWAVLRASQLAGVPIEMEKVLQVLPARESGHSLLEIKTALVDLGFAVEAREITLEENEDIALPCIVALSDPDHFIVTLAVHEGSLHCFDNGGQRTVVPIEKIKRRWKGVGLSVDRNDNVSSRYSIGRADESQMVFSTILKDKGVIYGNGHAVEFKFQITNKGPAPLVISSVDTDCSCTKAAWPDSPILANQTVEIKLTFKPNETGPFWHTATIHSNDRGHDRVAIFASGIVDRKVKVRPYFLKVSPKPNSSELSGRCFVTVSPDLKSEFEVTGITHDIAGLKASAKRMTSQDMESIRPFLSMNYQPQQPLFQIEATIDRNAVDNDIESLELEIDVNTNVPGFSSLIVPVVIRKPILSDNLAPHESQ
jgi:predicted double-glycine peptidase